MVTWLKEVFGVDKPVIAMAHMAPLPGDPLYDDQLGMKGILEAVRKDVRALQAGGVDGIMFSNEHSIPYSTKVGPETIAAMTYIISSLQDEVKVPFGVNALWDGIASIAIAKAVGAKFVREVFTGVYGSDMGFWDTNCAAALRYRKSIEANDVKLIFNIYPEFANALAPRPLRDVAKSTIFYSLADAITVSGSAAGIETASDILREAKAGLPESIVFCNTGVNIKNIEEKLSIADGVIIATSLKVDGFIWNPFDPYRVEDLMNKVKKFRETL